MSIVSKQEARAIFIAGVILIIISVKYRSQNKYFMGIQLLSLSAIIFLLFNYRESFHFEVSPSKTVNCCAKGFYGAPLEFHYDGDNTRFNNCPQQPPKLIGNPDNYDMLGQTYSTTEPFTNTYNTLGETYGKREGYQLSMNERTNNRTQYENLEQTGKDIQPFIVGPGKEHHSIYDMYTGGPPKIFNLQTEKFCNSCSGPNA